jgi:hypothetical protein
VRPRRLETEPIANQQPESGHPHPLHRTRAQASPSCASVPDALSKSVQWSSRR